MLTVQTLMAVPKPKRDLDWLRNSLQAAVQVELTTIPLYLAAWWSLKDPTSPKSKTASRLIREIVLEEMGHMGLACNMLSALGRDPLIASADVAPKFPGPLPGGIHPGLTVTPARYSDDSLQDFLTIEYPEGGPVALFWAGGQTYQTIGAFYSDVRAAFDDPNVQLPAVFDTSKQLLRDDVSVTVIRSKADAQAAIDLIKQQGEGTGMSPLEPDGTLMNDDDLAHYYKFGELFHKSKLRANPAAPHGYDFLGDPIEVPGPEDVYPMADVPVGGFAESKDFDRLYSQLLQKLQDAWREGKGDGTSDNLDDAIDNGMPALTDAAIALLKLGRPAPGGMGIVGPSFQFRP